MVPGRVATRSYPGGLYRYRIEAVGRQFTVDHTIRHEPGAAVGLRIPLSRLHIFPAAQASIPA